MKKQELSEIQNILSQRLKKSVQPVSCLYSDHLYKSSHRGLIQKMQMEKFRTLFQHQQKQKIDILHNLEQAKKKIKNLEIQKQTLAFAYKALQVRIRKSHFKQLQNNKITLEKIYRNSKIDTSFRRNSKRLRTSVFIVCHSKNQIKEENQVQEDYHPSSTTPKIQHDQYIQSRHQHLSIQNLRKQQQQFYQSKAIQECQNKIKTIMLEVQAKDIIVKEKDQQLQSLKNIIKTNNNESQVMIQKLKKTIQQLELNSINLKEIINEKQQLIKKYDDEVKQLQCNLQETQKKYQLKQMKEQHEVKLLKKFGQQLKISDSKIKQFMRQQFGQEIEGAFRSERAAYKQKISYLLHLSKKKQDLYENLIKDLKQRNMENLYRIQILQSKLDQSAKVQSKLLQMVQKKQIDKLYSFIKQSCK